MDLVKLKRTIYENSFYHFVVRSFHVLNPAEKLKDNWHIEYLCDQLQRKFEAFERGESQQGIIINVPPRSLKSIICTVCFPMWCWTRMPAFKFIASSNNFALSTEHNMLSRRLFVSEFFKTHWPHISFAGDQNLKTYFENNFTGVRRATATGANITGSGADVICIDDPVNPQESESEAERIKANEHFDRTLSSRLNDQERGFFILVMQRLHSLDLTGYLIGKNPELWEHIIIPAIDTDDVKPKELKKYYSGGLFFPDKFGHSTLEKAKANLGSYGYAGQMLQRPSPEEGGIWQKWFKTYPVNQQLLGLENLGTDWDLAYTEKQNNSASAFVTAGKMGRDMYITDIGWYWLEIPELVRYINSKQAPHYVEAKASGLSAIQMLISMGVPATENKNKSKDKQSMARDATPFVEAGRVFIREDLLDKLYNDSKQGILQFPNAPHDDLADALAASIKRVLGTREVWIS